MQRRLFNLAAALSLVLCVATVGLRVRSHFASDVLTLTFRPSDDSHQTLYYIRSVKGSAIFGRTRIEPASWQHFHGGDAGWSFTTTSRMDAEDLIKRNDLQWLGFGYRERVINAASTYTLHQILVPTWALTTICLVVPLTFVAQRFRPKARVPNSCLVCSYDLRATPDRCPECGAVPGSK